MMAVDRRKGATAFSRRSKASCKSACSSPNVICVPASISLPVLPPAASVSVSFPVPSYASEAFLTEVEKWFGAMGAELASLAYPAGPIVLVQVDNEGALYFRDGPYDQDYHPDAIRLFRAFLRQKYASQRALRDAWNDSELTFAVAMPPQHGQRITAAGRMRRCVCRRRALIAQAAIVADTGR